MSSTPNPEEGQTQSGEASAPPPEPGLTPAAASQPSATPPPDPNLRKEAKKRVKAKQQTKQLTGVFLIVWAIMIAVWAFTGGGYFWPMWAMLGMGIALGFSYWNAYGPSETISDSQVDEEMRRMEEGH